MKIIYASFFNCLNKYFLAYPKLLSGKLKLSTVCYHLPFIFYLTFYAQFMFLSKVRSQPSVNLEFSSPVISTNQESLETYERLIKTNSDFQPFRIIITKHHSRIISEIRSFIRELPASAVKLEYNPIND